MYIRDAQQGPSCCSARGITRFASRVRIAAVDKLANVRNIGEIGKVARFHVCVGGVPPGPGRLAGCIFGDKH